MRKKILINRKALNRGEAYVLLRRSKMRMSSERERRHPPQKRWKRWREQMRKGIKRVQGVANLHHN